MFHPTNCTQTPTRSCLCLCLCLCLSRTGVCFFSFSSGGCKPTSARTLSVESAYCTICMYVCMYVFTLHICVLLCCCQSEILLPLTPQQAYPRMEIEHHSGEYHRLGGYRGKCDRFLKHSTQPANWVGDDSIG